MAKQWSLEDKRGAVAAYLAHGSYKAAGEATGISWQTIAFWKNSTAEWWNRTVRELQDPAGPQIDRDLTPAERQASLRQIALSQYSGTAVAAIPFLTQSDWELADAVLGFSAKYLVPRYDDPKPTPAIHREWWALCMSDHAQVAIAAPRNHAKSSAITYAYVLYVLLQKHARHLLILGASEDMASQFLNDIKVELNENEELCADFGIQGFTKESETEIIVEFADGDRFRVLVKGAGSRMRGLKWERKRPDHIIFDDMEDEELVYNENRREKFRRWFYGTVRPILKVGGKIRGVGTIVGFDSLLERMMPPARGAYTIHEPLRTFSTIPQQGWAAVKYRAHNEDFTQVLWPEQHTAEGLRKIRSEYAARGELNTYGQEYLNDPVNKETAYFRQQDFLEMRHEDFHTRKTYYAAGDFAIGENERNAYTVLIVGGMDAAGVLHIVDVRRDRIDGLQIMEEMFSIEDRWSPEVFRTESENIEKAMGSFLYKEMDERQKYINIDSRAPTKDKDKRSQSIRARMRAGKVRFNKEADWYADFEDELLKFPKAPFKDQVDAFAWLGLMLEEMVAPNTDEEEDDEDYREAFEANEQDTGRCAVTGY